MTTENYRFFFTLPHIRKGFWFPASRTFDPSEATWHH